MRSPYLSSLCRLQFAHTRHRSRRHVAAACSSPWKVSPPPLGGAAGCRDSQKSTSIYVLNMLGHRECIGGVGFFRACEATRTSRVDAYWTSAVALSFGNGFRLQDGVKPNLRSSVRARRAAGAGTWSARPRAYQSMPPSMLGLDHGHFPSQPSQQHMSLGMWRCGPITPWPPCHGNGARPFLRASMNACPPPTHTYHMRRAPITTGQQGTASCGSGDADTSSSSLFTYGAYGFSRIRSFTQSLWVSMFMYMFLMFLAVATMPTLICGSCLKHFQRVLCVFTTFAISLDHDAQQYLDFSRSFSNASDAADAPCQPLVENRVLPSRAACTDGRLDEHTNGKHTRSTPTTKLQSPTITATHRTTKLNPKRWPTTLLTTALLALHFLPSLAMHPHTRLIQQGIEPHPGPTQHHNTHTRLRPHNTNYPFTTNNIQGDILLEHINITNFEVAATTLATRTAHAIF